VNETAPLLEVRELRTWLHLRGHSVRAVDGASFAIGRGEALGLVGESGSGKSMTCQSILRLEPRPAAVIEGGEIRLDGEDLLRRPLSRMSGIRGRRIGMILQDPLGSLNPVLTIGAQVIEALRLSHPGTRRAQLRREAAAALDRVGIRDAAARLDAYPFELSGGMRQRVTAAIAIVRRPDLLIADEPTTALDVTTQARFLALLDELRREFRMSLLLVTHDLALVAETCDRVAVMYAGRVVETAATAHLFRNPRHPYTRALLRAIPALEGPRARRLHQIPGEPPNVRTPAAGCRFAPRCAQALERCRREYPPTVCYASGDSVACWLHVPEQTGAPQHVPAIASPPAVVDVAAERAAAPLLELQGLGKTFVQRHLRRGRAVATRAVDGVSFAVREGDSVGVAGESGSGKSTLARMILRLERPDAGRILFAGADVAGARGAALRAYRRRVQAVFQDSAGALSPRMRIRDIVAEPLEVQQPQVPRAQVDACVADLLGRVGLSPELARCYPHELSGGQKQRVAISRALVVDPQMLVLDEPVSALDVSVRGQVLNLLLDLQQERGLTYLMIAHDLAILRHVTSWLVVMRDGRVVEQGPTETVLAEPAHPYTRELLRASPRVQTRQSTLVVGQY